MSHHTAKILIGLALYLLFLAWTFWPKREDVDDNPPGVHYPAQEHQRAIMAGTVDPLPEYEDRLYRTGSIAGLKTLGARLTLDEAWLEAEKIGAAKPWYVPPSGMDASFSDEFHAARLMDMAGFGRPSYASVDVFLPRGCKCSLTRNEDTRDGETFRLDHHPDCPILKHRHHVDLL